MSSSSGWSKKIGATNKLKNLNNHSNRFYKTTQRRDCRPNWDFIYILAVDACYATHSLYPFIKRIHKV